jgi:hypothetical protein
MDNTPETPFDWTPFLENAKEPFTFSIFIVYNTMRAAVRAAKMIEGLELKFARKIDLRLQSLALESLNDEGCYDRALSYASMADLIIVSASGPASLPPALKKWIAECTAHKREGKATVAALLGSMEEIDEADPLGVQFLKSTARSGDLNFLTLDPVRGTETAFRLPGLLPSKSKDK